MISSVKKALLLTPLWFCTEVAAQHVPDFVLATSASVHVFGSSNVADFRCDATKILLNGPLYADRNGTYVTFQGPPMRVAVRELACGNPMLNRDVCQTLREDRFPEIHFELESIEFQRLPRIKRDGYCKIHVELAGLRRSYRVPFRYNLTDRALVLSGVVPLTFSEFNLVPPRKMAGAVTVSDELRVQFNLPFEPVSR